MNTLYSKYIGYILHSVTPSTLSFSLSLCNPCYHKCYLEPFFVNMLRFDLLQEVCGSAKTGKGIKFHRFTSGHGRANEISVETLPCQKEKHREKAEKMQENNRNQGQIISTREKCECMCEICAGLQRSGTNYQSFLVDK